MRQKLGLLSTRQQHHTVETIAEQTAEIRKMFPTRGNETVRKELHLRYGQRVPRCEILVINSLNKFLL